MAEWYESLLTPKQMQRYSAEDLFYLRTAKPHVRELCSARPALLTGELDVKHPGVSCAVLFLSSGSPLFKRLGIKSAVELVDLLMDDHPDALAACQKVAHNLTY